MNRLVNAFRKLLGRPYWSLSQWAKLKVKNAVNYIGAFEQTRWRAKPSATAPTA
jgi:UDP-2,3-diacylglucosamine pyrophosphatase LpxH